MLSPGRGARLLLLSLGVLLAHLWLAGRTLPPRLGDGAGDRPPVRMDVAFVQELAPTAPPPVAPAPAPLRRLAALAAAPVASAALAEVESLPALEPMPPLPAQPETALAPAPELLPPLPAAASAPAPRFEWPPSTRLSYTASGNFRGPLFGDARVEWLRNGSRYQVFMEIKVGPFAQTALSEGELTEQGLAPRRYEEVRKALGVEARRQVIALEPERLRLANGNEAPRPPGVQDSASQFVQLTWLFTTQPQRLVPGELIELPLALPRSVQPWTYEVRGPETLATPFGPLETVYVKPRREAKKGSDLTAEMWVAPSLQYLPVRIVIRQDAETWLDLMIERLPQQAAEARMLTQNPAPSRNPP
jgi:hypothetical protein